VGERGRGRRAHRALCRAAGKPPGRATGERRRAGTSTMCVGGGGMHVCVCVCVPCGQCWSWCSCRRSVRRAACGVHAGHEHLVTKNRSRAPSRWFLTRLVRAMFYAGGSGSATADPSACSPAACSACPRADPTSRTCRTHPSAPSCCSRRVAHRASHWGSAVRLHDCRYCAGLQAEDSSCADAPCLDCEETGGRGCVGCHHY
jgi:hypothetical protein